MVDTFFQRRFGAFARSVLTSVVLQQAVCAAEVLRVLYDGDLGHADDDGVGAHLRGRRRVAAVRHVVERRGGVIIITEH